MDNDKEFAHDIIDEDLYEEIDEEELFDLVAEARKDALKKSHARRQGKEPKRPFPKWFFWLVAVAMLFNVFALLPQTFSIPAVEFLATSAKLSAQADIKQYKQSVVVIETETGRGTGFSFNDKGDILTNYHVIEGNNNVTVAFGKQGLFHGEVVETFPEIDLAIVSINEENMPFLPLAESFQVEHEQPIYFIGNPLQFNRIANQGTVIDWVYVQSKELPVVMLDAPVYRGNSGSPVIDDTGQVIGVVFATLFHDTEGRVGLFIPINYFFQAKGEDSNY